MTPSARQSPPPGLNLPLLLVLKHGVRFAVETRTGVLAAR
jgi:hypothetical protein